MKINPTAGAFPGTGGWHHPFTTTMNAPLYSVDGDAEGNMIVSHQSCTGYNQTTEARYGCTYHVTKLASADGTVVWDTPVSHALSDCRVTGTAGGSAIYCGFTMNKDTAGETFDFGNGKTIASVTGMMGIVMFNSGGVAQWTKAVLDSSFGDLAVSADGSVLAVIGGVTNKTAAAPDSA